MASLRSHGLLHTLLAQDQQEHAEEEVCVCCGKPAHHLVYWGKAY